MGKDLLFYEAYESFYDMVRESECFKKYCKAAFGEDFSQDGFSDVSQVNLILNNIPQSNDLHILDIGCGNGKMLKYLQKSIGGHISGFDFSENAIETARLNSTNSMDFRVGVIGEIDYPNESFDMITSMDSIYFANDMKKFVGQVKKWLKKGGIFFVGYQEGDVMPKTMNSETTVLSHALKENGLSYEVSDITQQTYNMLKNKRNAIINFKDDFISENLQAWYEMVLDQTNCVVGSFEKYAIENARYIYLVKL